LKVFLLFLQNAPKDKLLVYRVSEGWNPLCKFLGVDVPKQPFPHRNKSGSFMKEAHESNTVFRNLERELIATVGVLSVVAAVCSHKLLHSQALKMFLSGVITNWI